MPDINVDPDYPSHPKTIRLKALLGNDADIFPIRAWCWCAKYSKADGSFGHLSRKEIAYILGWFADPDRFIIAMVSTGFLEKFGRGRYRIHAWKERNGHILAMTLRGQENAKKRWAKIGKNEKESLNITQNEDASSNASSNARIISSNAPTNRTVPAVNTTAVTLDSLTGERQRLMGLRWKIDGEYFQANIISLPIDYCRWALKNLSKLGAEYRKALQLRIDIFEQDKIKL